MNRIFTTKYGIIAGSLTAEFSCARYKIYLLLSRSYHLEYNSAGMRTCKCALCAEQVSAICVHLVAVTRVALLLALPRSFIMHTFYCWYIET